MLAPRARMLVGAAALGAVVLACEGPGALAHVALSFAPLLAIAGLAWDGRYRGERVVLALHRRAARGPVAVPAARRRSCPAVRPRALHFAPGRRRGAPRAVRGPPLLVVVATA